MLTHSQLHEHLMKRVPDADLIAKQDRKNSISSKVIRCRYDGQRAVAVGSDSGAKAQISALLDLLDLHLHVPANVDADHVTLILGGCPAGSEALDAIGTLVHNMTSGPKVRVLVADDEDSLAPVGTAPCDFSTDAEYPGWIGLLMAVESGPPAVLRSLVGEVVELAGPHGAATQALRAYQMLSSPGRWSLRLEGLEVGQFKGASGWLGVGKVGKLGALSAQRQAWIAATGVDARITVTERAAELSGAAAALWKFAQQWLPRLKPDGNVPIKQDEHALESRVLRGFAPVVVPGVGQLERLREDPAVNWGSQFPTKWGRQGSPRYLDALLRDGSTPWAVEIKIQGGTGVGGYYRHAVAQAVLYRHFIRQAQPLQPWFDKYGLHQKDCRATVLVPIMDGPLSAWRTRLTAVANLWEIPVVEIEHKYAGIH